MNKKVLLVEDEAIIAMSTAKTIEKHGFVVVTAHKGEKAAEMAEEDPDISLILMDIDLGRGIDGTEAAQRILETHDLPIIFLTSHAEKEYVERVKKISNYGYVLKNSGEFVLIESINMAFSLFVANQHRKYHEQELENTVEELRTTNEQLLQKEEDLRENNRALRTLSECNQILVRDNTESELVQEICDVIVEKAGYRLCWIGYIEGKGKKRKVVPAAHSGFGKDYVENLMIKVEFGPTSKGPTATAARTKGPVVINRILDNPDCKPWKEAAQHHDYQSSIALPLMENNEVFAVLNVYASETDVFGEEEKKLLIELSEDLSYGIRNIRSNREKEQNEKLLDNIIENLPVGLQIFDQNGYSYRINKRQKELLGLPSEEEGLGEFNVLTDPYSITHGADKLYRQVYNGNSFIDMENEYDFNIPVNKWETRKEKRFFNESIFPIFTQEDQVGYVVSLLSDITEKKQMMVELKASERKFSSLFNSMTEGVCIHQMLYSDTGTPSDYIIIDVNPAYEKILNLSKRDTVGKLSTEVYHTKEPPFLNIYSEVLETKKPYQFETVYPPMDKHFLISVFSMGQDNFATVFMDITEQYEKERQLSERVKELDCLYKIADIVEDPNASINYILQKTAEVIPHSWRYPETCECRITLKDESFQSNNFSETKWKLSSEIIIENVVLGKVAVCYLDERPTVDEGPFLKEEKKLLDAIAERLGRVIERSQAEEKLRSIEWMLSSKTTQEEDFNPEYGDVSSLNKDGLILTSVGKEQLKNISSEYLDLLETSTAIYEKNGDYALGIFSSGWCRLMDTASRRLCKTKDNQEALESGKWLCHESCWKDARLSMNAGKPVEIKCNGGIKMYAVPIRANGDIVGAMNFGYGNPPTDEAELKRLSETYNIPIDELRENAEAYKPRPQFIIDYAKERIQIAAKNLGYIIERKMYEESINRERVFLSSVLDTLKEAIVICDENGKITRFNEAARRFHGVPDKPIVSEQWAKYYNLYTADGTKPLAKEDIPLFRALKGEDVHNAEIVIKPKNSPSRLLSCSGHQLIDTTGKKLGAVIAMHDITELKKSRNKYKRLIDNSPNLILETDVDTLEVISCNPAMAKNLGPSIPEIVGKKIDSFIPPDILKKRVEIIQKAIETEEAFTLEEERKGNFFLTTYIPIVNEERRSIQTITIDITDSKQNEENLRKAIEEKKFLMKELNHRVKNNLNMVSSLINLKDSEIGQDLSDLEHQIKAIGLIHEKLYQTESISEFDCKEYINDLINYIFSSFTERSVRIEENIDNITIPTKSAISLGLIINELATNAIKHGFSDKEEARFIIKLREHDNQYMLTISNTGTPFPEELGLENPQTIGLQLVSSLVAQVDGTIELQKKPNTEFTIRFPIGVE